MLAYGVKTFMHMHTVNFTRLLSNISHYHAMLWGVCCEDLGEDGPLYNGTSLYSIRIRMFSCKKMQVYLSWDGRHIVLVRDLLIGLHVLFSCWISNSSQLDWQSTIANETHCNQGKVTVIFKPKLYIQRIFRPFSHEVRLVCHLASHQWWVNSGLCNYLVTASYYLNRFWSRSSRPHGVTRPQYIKLRLLSNEHIAILPCHYCYLYTYRFHQSRLTSLML